MRTPVMNAQVTGPRVDGMKFVEHVRDSWSWLVAFRAVAETEHLPTAARELGLTPSSLSRSIRQLETRVGVELFDHRNKTLALNRAGRELLEAVRASMRLVDDAVRKANGLGMTGSVTAA
ncbi:MAG TPA: LysR family transcriptional regulator, partial [Kofleriaceae bacterium]